MKDLTCPVMASLDLCIEIRRRVRLDPAVALHRLMQRFQVGDRVVSLPRFAHLFQSDSGVIIEVRLDPLRPLFKEYRLEFPDGLTANLFEFQLLEASS